IEALCEAGEVLKAAVKLLENEDSRYAETFRGLAEVLSQKLAAQIERWRAAPAAAPAADPQQRRDGADKIRRHEQDLTYAVGDVEAMTDEMPWKTALYQARLAKEIASKADEYSRHEWYCQVLALAEAQGRKAVEQARWYDALNAYAGLEGLEKDNEHYTDMLKTVRRHIRVLSLYGKKNNAIALQAPPPDTQPKADGQAPSEEAGVKWQEMVEGVDPAMVKDVISPLVDNYVTAVDCRKLTVGALRAVGVLAETPQAQHSFPGLADRQKRTKFLEAIAKEVENVEQRDRVTGLQIAYALNTVVRASERTVQIPTDVIAVEFADGFLDELDKFSSIIWPSEVKRFYKQTTGEFYGVGIQISKEPGQPLRVETPLPDTPAYKKGVKVGDLILAVDGIRTRHLSLDMLVNKIMGPKGTEVTLLIKRQGVLKPFDVTIVRDKIEVRTVKGWRRQPDGRWDFVIDPENRIGYIRLTQFT
ncbi:MAG: PDZ domain-containing protein, partial [Phycisphaerae bacterium]|nr:PDZ domain-containing protein [Phycisphaerae bacterium]